MCRKENLTYLCFPLSFLGSIRQQVQLNIGVRYVAWVLLWQVPEKQHSSFILHPNLVLLTIRCSRYRLSVIGRNKPLIRFIHGYAIGGNFSPKNMKKLITVVNFCNTIQPVTSIPPHIRTYSWVKFVYEIIFHTGEKMRPLKQELLAKCLFHPLSGCCLV